MSRSWDLGSDLSENLSVSLSGFFSSGQDPNYVYNTDQYDTLLQDNGVAANGIGTVTPVIWAALGYANADAFWNDMYTNGILKSAIIAEIPSGGFTVSAWTGDADSGIDSGSTYTAAHNFAASGPVDTIQGVTFERGKTTAGSGWSMTGSASYISDASNNITGSSAQLATDLAYNGDPRVITFSGLTDGVDYEASFWSVGWAPGNRDNEFSASGYGPLIVDVDGDYGENNGAVVKLSFTASGTTQTVTISPQSGNSFHLYGHACRVA